MVFTIENSSYCETLQQLQNIIKTKKILFTGVLLRDNIQCIQEKFQLFKWVLFYHSTYRHNITPNDTLPSSLKKVFEGRKLFLNNKNTKTTKTSLLHPLVIQEYNNNTEKCVPHYDKCFSTSGNYVKKLN